MRSSSYTINSSKNNYFQTTQLKVKLFKVNADKKETSAKCGRISKFYHTRECLYCNGASSCFDIFLVISYTLNRVCTVMDTESDKEELEVVTNNDTTCNVSTEVNERSVLVEPTIPESYLDEQTNKTLEHACMNGDDVPSIEDAENIPINGSQIKCEDDCDDKLSTDSREVVFNNVNNNNNNINNHSGVEKEEPYKDDNNMTVSHLSQMTTRTDVIKKRTLKQEKESKNGFGLSVTDKETSVKQENASKNGYGLSATDKETSVKQESASKNGYGLSATDAGTSQKEDNECKNGFGLSVSYDGTSLRQDSINAVSVITSPSRIVNQNGIGPLNRGSHTSLNNSPAKDKSDEKHRGSSKTTSSRPKHEDSSKNKDKAKSHSSSVCHHRSDEKCRCSTKQDSHHSRRHSSKKKYENVRTQCTADDIANEARSRSDPKYGQGFFTRVPWVSHSQICKLKYGRYYRLEVDRNGGASVVHLYMDEISHLSQDQLNECAVEFIKLSYSEDENECAYYVMGIVHGAAAYLPDLVDYMADHYPNLIVKTGSLASRDNHTSTMSQYRDEVYKTYSHGTFRYAPLDQLSICGVLGEEVGAFFPDFVARLERSPFMKPVMPWSFLSVVETDNPRESNDGPIFWVRPGEQMIPANEALKEGGRPKKRRNNELDNLAYIGTSRLNETRESLFMDRTKAHADQIGVDGGVSNTAPTAAVGVLKSVNCGHIEDGNRATKDVVAFHAQNYNELLELLMLDLYEPPQTQCTKWIEVSKLNSLRREGIRYAHIQLHDNDVYYLPRKIIHQFQTISSVASVAWHVRYKDYFTQRGAPNLHTPTGINKGQVFYEKKEVEVYCPPVCEAELPRSPGLKTPRKNEKVKESSPFKHTPKRIHKSHSTPGSLKKDKKEVHGVSLSAGKRVEERTPVKKHERSKSVDEGHRSSSEKIENGVSSRSSSHRQSADEKKEHRKEVKNLDMEFSKRDRDRTPSKSKHHHHHHKKHRSHHTETHKELHNGGDLEKAPKRKTDDEVGVRSPKKSKKSPENGILGDDPFDERLNENHTLVEHGARDVNNSDLSLGVLRFVSPPPVSLPTTDPPLPPSPSVLTIPMPNSPEPALVQNVQTTTQELTPEEKERIRLKRKKKMMMQKMLKEKASYDLLGDIMAKMDKQ